MLDDIHEWANRQMIVLPLTKEFVAELIDRGTVAMRAMCTHYMRVDHANQTIRMVAENMVGDNAIINGEMLSLLKDAIDEYYNEKALLVAFKQKVANDE